MNINIVKLANKYSCTGCMACVDVCPKKAIFSYKGKDGHSYVQINKNLCINCKKCEKLCNFMHIGYGGNDTTLSKPLVSWANDIKYRNKGTSGGVFAALAAGFIQRGGIVFSAYFDGINAKHVCIKDVSEIPSLQGSKYVQSDTCGIYQHISLYISKQPILFCGLGCQVAAVLAFFKNHPMKDNLYTVDMVCGGVPSSLLITKYIECHPDVERITSYRSKRKYELRGVIDGKEVVLNNKPLPLLGFSLGHTHRYSCCNCAFVGIHRQSDLTLGDLWGNLSCLKEEYSKGVSLVLAHNNRGIELLKKSWITCQTISWETCLPNNPRIYRGKRMVSLLRRKLSIYAHSFTSSKFEKVYSFNLSPSDGLWYIYMRYWKIKIIINKKLLRNQWKKFILKHWILQSI